MSGTDPRPVVAVLDRLYTAWAENDADALADCYVPDATAALPGDFRGSREVIHDRMAAAFADRLKGSTVTDEVDSVRFLGPDVALVVSRSGVLLAGEAAVPDGRWVMATWVLTRATGEWLVAAYHNCPA